MAMDPAPTAEATRFTERYRTSPAVNTPGMRVSSNNCGRRSGQPFGGFPVGIKFLTGDDKAALIT
jgi:hypothetical protein